MAAAGASHTAMKSMKPDWVWRRPIKWHLKIPPTYKPCHFAQDIDHQGLSFQLLLCAVNVFVVQPGVPHDFALTDASVDSIALPMTYHRALRVALHQAVEHFTAVEVVDLDFASAIHRLGRQSACLRAVPHLVQTTLHRPLCRRRLGAGIRRVVGWRPIGDSATQGASVSDHLHGLVPPERGLQRRRSSVADCRLGCGGGACGRNAIAALPDDVCMRGDTLTWEAGEDRACKHGDLADASHGRKVSTSKSRVNQVFWWEFGPTS
mmetsp:Transcript_73199/g.190665  ORF Transcript_73199/g.190665 Transcript_73199/m.190665 type:complete len:264 (-) Transcript_73199:13-804(-)